MEDDIAIVDNFMESECFGVPECEAWERIKKHLISDVECTCEAAETGEAGFNFNLHVND
jgi:hypothetical protein